MGVDRPAHILVVDDDSELRALLSQYFRRNGYTATALADGAAMWRALRELQIDLLVLDVMLQGEDGLSLCRAVHAESDVPIILMSALGEDEERIRGLNAGADDYIVKPLHARELLSRVRAVLRRATRPKPRIPEPEPARRVFRFGEWRLDALGRTLIHTNGKSPHMTGAEFRLLLLLVTHPMQMLSRAQIVKHLRGRSGLPDRSIDATISRLRSLLDDDARVPHLIKTIYGRGYVLSVVVEPD